MSDETIRVVPTLGGWDWWRGSRWLGCLVLQPSTADAAFLQRVTAICAAVAAGCGDLDATIAALEHLREEQP